MCSDILVKFLLDSLPLQHTHIYPALSAGSLSLGQVSPKSWLVAVTHLSCFPALLPWASPLLSAMAAQGGESEGGSSLANSLGDFQKLGEKSTDPAL